MSPLQPHALGADFLNGPSLLLDNAHTDYMHSYVVGRFGCETL